MERTDHDLTPWYSKIRLRPDGGYQENYTFPGLPRSRRSLRTSDRDEAAGKVRDEWTILEHRQRQERFVAEGVINKEQVEHREELSLVQALGKYMDDHGNNRATRRDMLRFNKMLIGILGPDRLLSRIGTVEVGLVVKHLEKRSVRYRDGERPISESAINGYIKHLRAVMRRARKHWRVACSPQDISWQGDDGLMLPEPDYKRRIIVDEDEEDRIWAALAEDTRALYLFSVLTGMRQENAFTLTKNQVKWADRVAREGGVIEIRVKSRKRDRRTGQSGKILEVPITPRIAEILRSVWDQDEKFVFMYRCERNRSWTDKNGQPQVQRKGQLYPFTKTLLRRRWEKARATAGASNLKWHGLRATFITRLLEGGTPIHDVKETVGHASIVTTARYAVSVQDRRREAMERSERSAAERRATRRVTNESRAS